MPAGWVAGAAAIGSALIGANASSNAANDQLQASENSTATTLNMYNQNVTRLAPWVTQGNQAAAGLSGLLGLGANGQVDMNAPLNQSFTLQDFQKDPGYQFMLQQGQQGIMNNRASLGGLNSGATLKDLSNYSQGMASQEYGNAYNRWLTQQNNLYSRISGVSNTGANAAGMVAGLGANAASQMGANTMAGGNALAAGAVGQANALSGGIGNLMQAYLYQQNNPNNPGGSSYGGFNYDPNGTGAMWSQNQANQAGLLDTTDYFQ